MVIICLQYRLLKIADYGLARDNDDCLKSKGHGWKFAHSIIVFFAQNFFFLKNNCEQFAQIAHDKRVPVSNLLRLLTKNEQL